MIAGEVWAEAQGAQSVTYSDRGIARYVGEHLRALLALEPSPLAAVSLNGARPLTGNLGFLLGTGMPVLRGPRERPPERLPRVYHVMSAFELGHPLAEVWPEWARVPEVATVVTLYDLIPLIFAGHYLAHPQARARYMARLALVRGARHVLAISEATAADAVARLGLREDRITVIDAGVAAPFRERHRATGTPRTPVRDGYLLYVGGIEYRKNNERLIAAYGRLAPALRARHQLVLACSLRPEDRRRLEALAAAEGVGRDELVLTGHVSDQELAALYEGARLFVFPSFYEGSGLPLLEAMAAGLPIAAAAASTTPEILGDLDATFDPFDTQDMARVLAEVVADDLRLARLRERSRRRIGRYTWEHVAERTVAGYDAALRAGARRRSVPRRRRIALVTPWPPERSGIADYNERLVAALAEHVDVDVVVDGSVPGHVSPRGRGTRLVSHEDHRRWSAALRAYDRILYCVGNSHFHGWILEALAARPGTVVAHDVRLTGLYGTLDGLPARLDAMYGARVEAPPWRDKPPSVAEQEALGLFMTHEVQRHAHAVLVHSRAAADVLQLDRPAGVDPPIDVVALAAPPALSRHPDSDRPFVLSLGLLSESKDLRTVLEAFALVASGRPALRLVLAGDAPGDEAARWATLARELGVGDRVELRGYVPAPELRQLLASASACVQLRLVANGEASAAVADALAAGLPTVVTDLGWFSELPRDAVVHVPRGVAPQRLASSLERLLDDATHAEAVSAGARRHAARTSAPAVARAYLTALFGPADPPALLAPAAVTVVVITRDRRAHVELALAGLARQTTGDFAVVVADEGSTDGTRELVEDLAVQPLWRGRLRWVHAGQEGTGCSRPRNAGARAAAPGSGLLLFLDADMVADDAAVARALRHHRRHPGAAVFGVLQWTLPLAADEALDRIRRGGASALLDRVPRAAARRVEGTVAGPDPRGPAVFAGRPVTLRSELALFGCGAVPARVFDALGGFDEEMRGYGYEDMEFGVRLAAAGVEAVMADDVRAVHVWHPKPDWDVLALQNERNLDYVLRKHGSDATPDDWADWSVWWHYHAERGGRVVRDEADRLWAVDHAGRFRLALDGEDWLARLGTLAPEDGDPSALPVAGEARLLALERAPSRGGWPRAQRAAGPS